MNGSENAQQQEQEETAPLSSGRLAASAASGVPRPSCIFNFVTISRDPEERETVRVDAQPPGPGPSPPAARCVGPGRGSSVSLSQVTAPQPPACAAASRACARADRPRQALAEVLAKLAGQPCAAVSEARGQQPSGALGPLPASGPLCTQPPSVCSREPGREPCQPQQPGLRGRRPLRGASRPPRRPPASLQHAPELLKQCR